MQSVPRAEAPPTLIHVAYANGRWRVTESGGRNVVSNFGERRDAMEYAAGLATRTRGSLVIHKGHLDLRGEDAAQAEGEGGEAPPTARS